MKKIRENIGTISAVIPIIGGLIAGIFWIASTWTQFKDIPKKVEKHDEAVKNARERSYIQCVSLQMMMSDVSRGKYRISCNASGRMTVEINGRRYALPKLEIPDKKEDRKIGGQLKP